MRFNGQSVVASPQGELLLSLGESEEGLFFASLPPSCLAGAGAALEGHDDFYLRDRRPALYDQAAVRAAAPHKFEARRPRPLSTVKCIHGCCDDGQHGADAGEMLAYGRLWALHQLAPFADSGLRLAGVLGAAGPVDARPLCSLDWAVRLPLSLLLLVRPSASALLAAHVSNLLLWAVWMPMACSAQGS